MENISAFSIEKPLISNDCWPMESICVKCEHCKCEDYTQVDRNMKVWAVCCLILCCIFIFGLIGIVGLIILFTRPKGEIYRFTHKCQQCNSVLATTV